MQKVPVFQKKPLKQPEQSGSSMFDANYVTPIEKVLPGVEVIHEKFGQGKVLNVEGTGPNTKATVFFNGVGQKQLLLKFAKLKIL